MTDWHCIEIKDVFSRLHADSRGLSQSQAVERLERYGYNQLTSVKKQSAFIRFLKQFHNVLIYVLLATACVTFLLHHFIDTAVILTVVIINALIGFIQEGKAEQALQAIEQLLTHNTLVLRDHKRITIAVKDIVPGDIIFLQSGDKVPADCRLIQEKGLIIDESILTGESGGIYKSTNSNPAKTTLGDRTCMAFSGTLVTHGQGTAIVVSTGDETQIGHISCLLAKVERITTPLLRQIGRFSKWLSFLIVLIASITFVYGVWIQGNSMSEMFLAAVSLAVAAIPEGLPAIITITLALGVQRMAHYQSIIRVLPAVETLGAVTVICSDKTGTLTRNEMTVQSIATQNDNIAVTGVGYDPHGGFSINNEDIDPTDSPSLMEILRASLLCNDASIVNHNEEWIYQGDPTEAALVAAAHKAGLLRENEHESYPRADVIPFDASYQFMASLHHDHEGNSIIYMKGAPETILRKCHSVYDNGQCIPINKDIWEARIHAIASQGQRILGVCAKYPSAHIATLDFPLVERDMVFLGLVGIIDPPRPEVINAIQTCQHAGIRVKMITGDHKLTAQAIGKMLNIGDGQSVMTGEQISAATFEALQQQVKVVDVFARVSPENKLRLVQALQKNGEVAAMTGDGVNDAPALKQADIGVAMGITGTQVSREAADMVLLDDCFTSIKHAVEQGRTTYNNIVKSLTFILPTNGGEAGLIIFSIFMGTLLPITPLQVLWVNMITAVTLALALAFEPHEEDIMHRPPRMPDEALLSGFLLWRIGFVSVIIVAGCMGLFLWERGQGHSIEYARTVTVNALVAFEIFYLLNTRFLHRNVLSYRGLTGNKMVWLAIALVVFFQLLFTHLPIAHQLFSTVVISIESWLLLVIVASLVLLIVETEKLILRSVKKLRLAKK